MAKWVWIDLELTGLDPSSDKILEISVILSDPNCISLVEGPTLVLSACQHDLDSMSSFVTKMHSTSGLLQQVQNSDLTLPEAESQILSFLESQNVHNGILAGNSVHMDRMFLTAHMPRLFEQHIALHRLIDVSSFKEAYTMWVDHSHIIPKKLQHRSLEDIKESIKEMKFYLSRLY